MALPAVTMQRIEAVLKREELEYDVDKDGEVFVRFDNANFGFQWMDGIDVLRIYGFWRGDTTDIETIAKLEQFIQLKNSDIFLPKLNSLYADDGSFRVGYEYCTPAGGGLTDEQLYNIVIAVFSTTFHVVEGLENEFPELVTWVEQEDGE